MVTTHRNKIICVIGMGRSGTSLACQILDKLGVYFGEPGELLPASPNNERGHWEHAGINGILEGALSSQGMSWLTDRTVPRDWWTEDEAEPAYQDTKKHLKDLLERASAIGNVTLGFKNPRTILFLPLFESVFQALDLEPVYIRCLRDPREVYASIKRTQSLEARTLTLRECYGIWSNYYIASQAVDALDVWYEDWFHDREHAGYQISRIAVYTSSHERITSELTAPVHHAQQAQIAKAFEVIDPKLRHAYADADAEDAR